MILPPTYYSIKCRSALIILIVQAAPISVSLSKLKLQRDLYTLEFRTKQEEILFFFWIFIPSKATCLYLELLVSSYLRAYWQLPVY